MEIDLDSEVVITAKFKGKEYPLSEPTVSQIQVFQKEMKASEDEMEAYSDFLEKLGLPKTVTKNLGITKIKKLSDGLIGTFEKK